MTVEPRREALEALLLASYIGDTPGASYAVRGYLATLRAFPLKSSKEVVASSFPLVPFIPLRRRKTTIIHRDSFKSYAVCSKALSILSIEPLRRVSSSVAFGNRQLKLYISTET